MGLSKRIRLNDAPEPIETHPPVWKQGAVDQLAITIKDVAKAANVSVSTVSLVLNNSSLVKMETRYKVLQTIKELDYTPNHFAQSLVTNRKNVIGLTWMTYNDECDWFSFVGHPGVYLTEMLPGIERELNDSSYSMLLEHFNINNQNQRLPSIMINRKVDGILMVGGIVTDEILKRILDSGIPAVLVGSRYDELDFVDTDPKAGVRAAIKHLAEMGHQKLCLINGPQFSQTTHLKQAGFDEACREFGIAPEHAWSCNSNYSGASGYESMKAIWKRGYRPTAILGGHDAIVLGAMRFLFETGLKCPDDFSAIGYEDNLLADYSNPPLTTIRIKKEQMGLEGCRVLLNRIRKPTAKTVKLIIEPELVLRKSVRSMR